MTRVGNEIRLERIVEAPREDVFRAWTDPDQLMHWWGPENCTTPYAEVDLRPGGKYLFVMHPPEGEPLRIAGVYREVAPPQRLVYTWKWEAGVPDPTESLVTVEFDDLGERTRITITHSGFEAGSPTESYNDGWTSALNKLATFLRR
jgi:uncharacterized protein YndB with AHSA1/START domain